MQRDRFGLLPDQLNRIIQILTTCSKVTAIILFGSRAKGNYRLGSDIDIALKTEGFVTLSELNHLRYQLDELMLPYQCDLLIFEQLENADLKAHIQSVGIPVWSAK